LQRQQPENVKKNVDVASPGYIFADAYGSRLAILLPEFRQSCPWGCSVHRSNKYKPHVAETEQSAIVNMTNILNAQLPLGSSSFVVTPPPELDILQKLYYLRKGDCFHILFAC